MSKIVKVWKVVRAEDGLLTSATFSPDMTWANVLEAMTPHIVLMSHHWTAAERFEQVWNKEPRPVTYVPWMWQYAAGAPFFAFKNIDEARRFTHMTSTRRLYEAEAVIDYRPWGDTSKTWWCNWVATSTLPATTVFCSQIKLGKMIESSTMDRSRDIYELNDGTYHWMTGTEYQWRTASAYWSRRK